MIRREIRGWLEDSFISHVRQDIAYLVSLVNWFMHDPLDPHMQVYLSHFSVSEVCSKEKFAFL